MASRCDGSRSRPCQGELKDLQSWAQNIRETHCKEYKTEKSFVHLPRPSFHSRQTVLLSHGGGVEVTSIVTPSRLSVPGPQGSCRKSCDSVHTSRRVLIGSQTYLGRSGDHVGSLLRDRGVSVQGFVPSGPQGRHGRVSVGRRVSGEVSERSEVGPYSPDPCSSYTSLFLPWVYPVDQTGFTLCGCRVVGFHTSGRSGRATRGSHPHLRPGGSY